MVRSGISYRMEGYTVKYVSTLSIYCVYSHFDIFTFSNYKGITRHRCHAFFILHFTYHVPGKNRIYIHTELV